jgi:ABC-type branched-subunit amino acid transport system substrate-binding protein
MRALRLLLLVLLAPALLQAGAPPSPGEQKKQIERGRRIYLEGASPSGAEITAVMSEASVEVPASAVPCAGCHGRDGKGRPEGGVSPTDLTWSALTRPYGATHASGRKHPAYDEKTLKRAIAMGLDPAGNPLHVAMPRFRMNQADMADLLAYMKQLGTEKDPGVAEGELRIGVLLPPAGPLSPMGKAIRSAVSARFDQVNKNGGIYGRLLAPRFLEAPGPPEQRRSWTEDFLTREGIFAGVASFLAGADSELANLFAQKEVPLVGPFTLHPRESVPLNRYVFYLLPGVEIQAQALAHFVRQSPGGAPRPAIVVPNDKALDEAVKALRKIAAAEKWPEPLLVRSGRPGFTPTDVANLARQKADPVFFLGSGPDARTFLQAADRLNWHPRVLATAPAADASLFDIPAAFAGRVFAALPTAPSPTGKAAAAYRELDAAAKLPEEHLSAQLSALASADILIEALRRAGRDVSRDQLVIQLETLRKLDTGFAPPVTYGPNRRMGARGAYIVKLDLQKKTFEPVGGWVEVE